jgi:malonyl CoA-acyl carrier protein transacylase/phosphopantetheinyl transferase
MVSPELEREYARRGISMIAPEDGVAALFGELAWGDHDTAQAVYMAGGPDSAAAFAGGEVAAAVPLQPRPAPARPTAPPEASASPGATAETTLRLAGTSPAELLAALDRHALEPTATPAEPAEGACRLAIVDPTPERLALARKVIRRGSPWRGRNDVWFTNRPLLADGRIAFLFPGFEPEPLGDVVDVAEHFGLPRPSIAGTGELVDQAADIVAVGRLLAVALERLGITPDLLAGHSLGEWTAMIVSGMWRPENADDLHHLFRIGRTELPDTAYAALACSAEQAAAAVGTLQGVVVSHDNCPHQSVVCGPPEQVDALLATLRQRGVLGQVVPFRSGFHSPMMADFVEGNRPAFDALSLRQPSLPVWSATSVAPYPDDPAAVRDLVLRHLLEPVRFRELIEALYRDGVRAFVQVGTGSLTGFVQDTLGARDHLAVAALSNQHSGLAQLDRVTAALWVEGIRPRLPLPPGGGSSSFPSVRAATATLTREEVSVDVQTLAPLGAAPPRTAPLKAPVPDATVVRTPRVFSLDTMPELIDHCLVPQAPGWPDVTDAFPVVPMTTLLDVMAEAAVARFPTRTVVGFRGVRALRWLAVAPPVTAVVETHEEADGYVRVKIEGYAEGLVRLADAFPEAPLPAGWMLTGARTPVVDAVALYEDGWMFHGPRFAGVAEITGYGDDGIRGVIETLPASGALLDCAGQLAGHWAQVSAIVDRSAFPTNIETVSLFGPHPVAGTRIACDVTIRAFSAETLRCDLELRTPDGAVWARIDGWTCRRFASDGVAFPALHTEPSRAAIGQAQPGGWCLVTDRWPDHASQEVVMRRYLNAAERAEYEGHNPRARRAWLLGRIAAKDAARHLLWSRDHGPLFPAEISVGNDAEGRPWLRGPAGGAMGVSIAHTAGYGVAVATLPDSRRVGIDVEAIGAVTEAIAAASFTREELALIDGRSGGRRAWLTRCWCAKEAVAKAEGTGLAGRPHDFVVTEISGETLTVTAHGRTYRLATCILDGSHVVAWTATSTTALEAAP